MILIGVSDRWWVVVVVGSVVVVGEWGVVEVDGGGV